MTVNLQTKYLDREQIIEKYPFLSANMMKNLLYKDINGFRSKVVKKIGRRLLFDEEGFLKFIAESKSYISENSDSNLDIFIEELSKKLPDQVSDKDLVNTGLFSVPWLSRARKRGESPPHLKIHRKYIYLKKDVLQWIRKFYVSKTRGIE